MNRLSNFEFVRIIAMCFVVISHYAQHGLVKAMEINGEIFDFVAMYLHTFGQIGVALFVLLTGYFMIDKVFNIRHVFSIVLETIFYSWGILSVILIFFKNYITLTPKMIYMSILPISTNQYWFVTTYLVLYILIPIINRLFNTLDKQTLGRYLWLFAMLWCLFPAIGFKIHFAESYITTFIYLYFIGAYIKRYGISFFEKKLYTLITMIVAECIMSCWIMICTIFSFYTDKWYMHLSQTHSIFVILIAISIFVLFKNIEIKNNAIINYFASSAFAVYLITENICMRKIIWIDIFHCNYSSSLHYIIFNMFFAVLISYVICTFLDKIRAKFLGKWLINFIDLQYRKVYSFITKFI